MSYVMPEGGLQSPNRIVLGYWNSSQLYVLCATNDGRYQFNPAINTSGSTVTFDGNSAGRMAVFEIGGSIGSITLKQVLPTSNVWLGFTAKDSVNVATISNTNVKLRIDQSSYATWAAPTLALSGVGYSVSPSTNTIAPIQFYVGQSTTPTVINPIVIATEFYNNCSKSGCTYTSGPQTAVLMTYCTLINSPGQSKCSNVPSVGWTTITDAQSAHPYPYCSVGQYCQTNCKASCQNKNTQCTYNTKTQSFGCTFGGTGLQPTTFWKTTWFLILMIAIGFIAVVAVIVAIYWIFFHGKSKKSDSGYDIVQKTPAGKKKTEIPINSYT